MAHDVFSVGAVSDANTFWLLTGAWRNVFFMRRRPLIHDLDCGAAFGGGRMASSFSIIFLHSSRSAPVLFTGPYTGGAWRSNTEIRPTTALYRTVNATTIAMAAVISSSNARLTLLREAEDALLLTSSVFLVFFRERPRAGPRFNAAAPCAVTARHAASDSASGDQWTVCYR